MPQANFGLFDWLDWQDNSSAPELYEERLQFLEVADDAGFFAYHLAEHHSTRLNATPSPALFLAAATQRTRKIRLGPLTYLLPLYHPLRLIEEVCMLDQLSGGRLELGIGRGVSPYQLSYFGVDPAESRAIFDETLAVLTKGLRNPRLTFEGEHFQYHDVPMVLQPLQKPYPPLWYPTHNPESVAYAGAQGHNFMGLGPATFLRQLGDLYWQNWEANRQSPDRLNGHVSEPKVAAVRHVFVADSDAEALAATQTAYANWFDALASDWHAHNDHSVDAIFGWEAALAQKTVIFGTPERVREDVAELLEVSGCNYVACGFSWGGLSQAQALHSMRLFSEEVMPAFTDTSANRRRAKDPEPSGV